MKYVLGEEVFTSNDFGFNPSKERWAIYRFGNNVGAYMLKQWGLSQDVKEHTVYSSFIMQF